MISNKKVINYKVALFKIYVHILFWSFLHLRSLENLNLLCSSYFSRRLKIETPLKNRAFLDVARFRGHYRGGCTLTRVYSKKPSLS